MPSADFEKAYKDVTNLQKKPDQNEQLDLYVYAKIAQGQKFATDAKKPSGLLDIQGKYKYNHWERVDKEGLSATDADKKYVAKVKELQQKYGTN